MTLETRTPKNTHDDPQHAAQAFLAKAVAKAIQSEKLAAEHYRALATIAPDGSFARRVREDATVEARHATALARAADRDGLVLHDRTTWDHDVEGVRAAFSACIAARDIDACLFVQDVFLETIAIEFDGLLARAAESHGALALAVLLDKRIIPDERMHLASGLREIARRLPDVTDRAAAFQRASVALVPALLAFAEPAADVPCCQTCTSCGDRCLKLDAASGGVPLAGSWSRIVSGIEEASRRIGVHASFAPAS